MCEGRKCTIFILSVYIIIVNGFRPPKVKISYNGTRNTVFQKAAVVTNSEECTNIALEVLSEEGSAADAAIAALICEGVTNPQSMGIGGGFLLAIYSNDTKHVEILNAREAAPAKATQDMFKHLSDNDIPLSGLSVAVPGELKGYWALHKRYGKISWYDLFRPSIELCKSGATVTQYTGRMIAKVEDEIVKSPSIKELLTNPDTNALYKEGELMVRPQLAETLALVAKDGPNVLYNGPLTEDFIYDIEDNGGIITAEDLKDYRALWERPFAQNVGNWRVHTVPPPGSGSLLLIILQVMARKLCSKDALYYHRLIETWKFAYGIRSTITAPLNGQACQPTHVVEDIRKILNKIDDCKTHKKIENYFAKGPIVEDHGTSHISILAPNGDAVAVTSTINLSFGSMFVSESTGIILNNEMLDFSIPNHYKFGTNGANMIAPKRQPMSSMIPTIITHKKTGQLRLIIGSSGGFKILTSTSLVILEHIFMDMSLEEAIEAKRIHNQLNPMVVEYEEGFNEDILSLLVRKGHKLQQLDKGDRVNSSSSMAMHSCVNAIAVTHGEVHAVADWRRRAFADGF